MKKVGAFILLFSLYASVSNAQSARAKIAQNKFTEVPLSSIRPKGWLLNQLNTMRNGSTGHLDEIYGKIKNDNGWLGGKGDGWEETPYWLDGAVPLAYLLNDESLKNKVLGYINWTIDNQRPSGYFGPITKWERETGNKITEANCDKGEDWWPKMVMLKVLQQYYSATADKRVIPFMTRYFHYQLATLKTCPVGKWSEWAQSRGADNVLIAEWLYRQTKDASLLKLCETLEAQSFPWASWFSGRDWVINAATLQNNDAWMTRHGVNVGMGLKDPIVKYARTGDSKYLASFKTGFNDLMTLHGLPFGVFSADEDLHGNNPTQGTELCAIVESMFSLEEAIAATGSPAYMDALERMTFNALPAQTTDDYNNKQYFQIANQVQIKRGVFNFSLPFEREMNNVLGMRSGYTCCLANMHQGWTKFTSHLWYQSPGNGIAALHFSPSEITIPLGKEKQPVTINEETNYPFNDEVVFTVSSGKAASFPFHLRIPGWCREAEIMLNGKLLRKDSGNQVIRIDRVWQNGDKVILRLRMTVKTSNWGGNSRAVERGPLVYALKLKERWEKQTDEREGEYFNVFPEGDWNYGILESVVKKPVENTAVNNVAGVGKDFIWNLAHAPIEIQLPAKKIPDWKLSADVAPQPVTAREGLYKGQVAAATEQITLVPYGCTKVRIVAFPVVK